jgi:YD repeat-containing protein
LVKHLTAVQRHAPPQTASFACDADGRLADQAMPDGIIAVYSYDAAGQLTEIATAVDESGSPG